MKRGIVAAFALLLAVGCASVGGRWQHEDSTLRFRDAHTTCAKQATSVLGLPPHYPHDLDRSLRAIRLRFEHQKYAHQHRLYVDRCLGVLGWEWR